jgi:autotransporter translocation and assembly factor TamB
VAEDGRAEFQTGRKWRGRVLIGSAVLFGLVLIFHRPLLLGLGRQIVLHYAAREHVKADFRLEGTVFNGLVMRDLHAVRIGPGPIESIDAETVHADYDLLALLLHGPSQLLKNVEVRSAQIVLDPAKAASKPHRKIRLPALFPERGKFVDTTLIMRGVPHDLAIEHVDLDLDPGRPGELRIDKLQLPAGQSWRKISGQTSYTNRSLILRDLALNNQERIRLLNVDASKIAAKTLSINLEAAIGAGTISGSMTLNETRSSLNTKVHFLGERIQATALDKYLGLPEGFISGQIERFSLDGTGVLNKPNSWSATMSAKANDLRQQQITFDHCAFELSAQTGRAILQSADMIQGKNEFHLRGAADLPADLKQFGRTPAMLEITAAASDLEQLTAGTPQPLTGSAQIQGKIEIKNGRIDANFMALGGSIGFENGTIEKLSVRLSASKTMPPSNIRKSWFADLRSAVDVEISKARYRDYAIDSAEGVLRGVDDVLKLERLNLRRNQNDLSVRGRYRLPEKLSIAASQSAQVDLSWDATELGDYWISDSPDKITGPLHVAAQIERKQGLSNGQITIFGSNVKMRDLLFKQLSSQCSISNNVIYVNDFTASLNERDFVGANGLVDLRAPHRYRGKVSASVGDLSTLEPLFAAYGNEHKLAGSFFINWDGRGETATSFKHSGKLKLALEKGRYGDLQSLQANVEATYSPDGLDIPTLFFVSNKMDFQAIVRASGETLEITKIQLDQGTAKYASGYVSVPFIWKNLGTRAPVSPSDGKVTATFQSENIDIKKLFGDVGVKPVASGTVNVKLDAQGTLADLNARLDVRMRDVRSEQLPKLEPATFDLTAQAQHNQLNVSGKLQQTKIQPLELTANLPFNMAKILRQRKVDETTPLTAKIRLPRSSVNFLRQFVPAIQQLDGDVALDVNLGGTIGRPLFTGAGDMTVNLARFSDPTLPALTNFKGRLNFARDALTLERFGGELAGGPFSVTGRITFPKLTAANLDLQLKANSALIARNDTLTARADANIKVVGPIGNATVTGNVALTNSEFLKNIDLIPIGLPGRPAPQPPSSRPDFSFPQPPIRNWKFDVAIKTKDAVLIRGNLANGGAVSDLKLSGTGLHPGLQGLVRLNDVEATLPFSRLEIASGFLYFDPSDSMNPKIDLHGTSLLRDYTIHVYVYGTLLAPEALFSSEPPLPQEEVISLLATGATREELTANNNVLAGRAATLLVQQLYRKIFKKGQPTKGESVFNRLDVDFGTVDPRTGQQKATARFKVNQHFLLVGDLGVGGDFRGMVRYLIRFR